MCRCLHQAPDFDIGASDVVTACVSLLEFEAQSLDQEVRIPKKTLCVLPIFLC